MRAGVAAAFVVAAALAGQAAGATGENHVSSSNWSGYAVTAPGTAFTSATATWKQPAVTCGAADAGAATTFWVGLGGYDQNAKVLEQAGTHSSCNDDTGKPQYYAWYEVGATHAVHVNLTIRPGDTITASVNMVDASTVLVQVKNRTRHGGFTQKLPVAALDLSSAEWVAEMPSECFRFFCSTVPLANFGSVLFSKIAALGNGIGGTLTNPSWSVTSIKLVPGGADALAPRAVPTAISVDGTAFGVSWRPTPAS